MALAFFIICLFTFIAFIVTVLFNQRLDVYILLPFLNWPDNGLEIMRLGLFLWCFPPVPLLFVKGARALAIPWLLVALVGWWLLAQQFSADPPALTILIPGIVIA